MSNSKTTTPTLSNKYWWIKFKEGTGKILSITSFKPQVSAGQLLLESNDYQCVLAKNTSFKNYAVRWDTLNDQWFITDRNHSSLVLKKTNHSLFQITKANPQKSDINLRVYKDSETLEVKANMRNIMRTMNITTINEVARSDDNLLDIYVTAKNDPDRLLFTITVDPLVLIKKGKIRFQFKDVEKWERWEDVDFYVKKVFESYSIEILREEIKDSESNNRPIHTTDRHQGHIKMKSLGDRIRIISPITEDQQYLVSSNIYLKFLVCDAIIDNIVGAFSVHTDDLIDKDEIDIPISFDMPKNPIFVYKNKHLKVQYTGDVNV